MRRACAAVLPMLAWAVCAPAAVAGIRPSFYLDGCGWEATHVVVVDLGEKIDGKAVVLEPWKGDLRKGDRLNLPGLAAFADPKTRALGKPLVGDPPPDGPTQVSGRRVVLFLRWQPRRDDSSKGDWLPASRFGGLPVSMAWVEKGQAFAVVQRENPGPSEMIPLDLTEAKVRERVRELVRIQADVGRAAAKADPGERAEALRPYVGSDLYYAREAAFQGLGGCGPKALPVLRKLLGDAAL